jgi:hypothetical protein
LLRTALSGLAAPGDSTGKLALYGYLGPSTDAFLVCSKGTRLTEWVTKRKLGRRPFLVEVVMTFSRRSMGSCLALLTLTIVSSPPTLAKAERSTPCGKLG